MNSSAVKDPELVRKSAERFGSQCTVVAIDEKNGKVKPIWGMGRHNHENSVAIPGYDELVVLSGDSHNAWAFELGGAGVEFGASSVSSPGAEAYLQFVKPTVLARALVNDPRLLMLDEPTTGLDPQARHLMWERLQVLLQQGKSILLTTHFMDEAERLCTRLLVLDHGRKIAEGRPRDLIAEHLEPDVVEAYGNGALALADSPLKALAARTEVSGETVFFYTQDARPLLDALAQHPKLRVLHRPANLEDLFLKLTGRQIREGG